MTSPKIFSTGWKNTTKIYQSIARNGEASKSHLTVKVASSWKIETSLLFFRPSSGFVSSQILYQVKGIRIGMMTIEASSLITSLPLSFLLLHAVQTAGLKVLFRGS